MYTCAWAREMLAQIIPNEHDKTAGMSVSVVWNHQKVFNDLQQLSVCQ